MPAVPKTDLTANFVRSILDYDPLTGIFRWKERPSHPKEWNTRRAGKVAGNTMRGYWQIRIDPHGCYPAHRLAWLITYGKWPTEYIDHANGDPSDNRLNNLREATVTQNMCNKKKQANNTSGFVGVRYRPHHGKWEGRINRAGKTVWRGYFDSAQEAGVVRREVLATHHGKFARHHDLP